MKLKELREERGMTQRDVAAAVHVTKSAVCMWENGVRSPTVPFLIMLADLFGVTLDALLGRTSPGKPEKDAS